MNAGRDVFSDIAMGATSGLAVISSPAAPAIGLAGLVVGAGADQMNEALYFGETSHAMEIVIRAGRQALREQIRERAQLGADAYPVVDVLRDVRRYSEMCSVRFGLARLREAAQASARLGF
jgi:hypothetical protein